MNRHVTEYYVAFSDHTPEGKFHAIVPLHDTSDLTWKHLHKIAPSLPRGWYELSRLPSADRVEFTRDYWISRLPYHPEISNFLTSLFKQIDDIGIYLTQKTFEDPMRVEMAYSLGEYGGFFQGSPPVTDNELAVLQQSFPGQILPADYRAFLRIHNGFAKHSDTGIFTSKDVPNRSKNFQADIGKLDPPLKSSKGEMVNPKTLIPFYESYGLPCYQCFWSEWYPLEEMGNVYYSGLTKILSDFSGEGTWGENLAFPTFLDWLMFYLERMEENRV
jgi:hypothetical protein